MSLQSPIGRVRGLGSAKEGVHHWWSQRVTALVLIPLSLWFIYSLVMVTGADYATVVDWLANSSYAAFYNLTLLPCSLRSTSSHRGLHRLRMAKNCLSDPSQISCIVGWH